MIANLVMSSKCGKGARGRFAKMKSVTLTVVKGFACEQCVDTMEGIVEPGEEISFFDQDDFVKSFCYLGERLNAKKGS